MRSFRMVAGVLFIGLVGVWLGSPWGRAPRSLASRAAAPPSSALAEAAASSVGEQTLSAAIQLLSGPASNATSAAWTSRTPAAVRVRPVVPNFRWLTPAPSLRAGDRIALNFFDDAAFDAQVGDVTLYPNGAVGLTAHLIGEEAGTLYLAYSGEQMRATVDVISGKSYAIVYQVDAAAHYALEVDLKRSRVLGCGASAEAAGASASVALESIAANSVDELTPVDVMLVYTPAALAFEGNLDNMNAHIAAVMQRANQVHANSNTGIELRLVHSAQVAYTESTASQGYAVDLENLTNHQDGQLDEVHELRDQYGADFVCLLEDTDQTGGVGWLLNRSDGDASHAFCLARVQQSAWTYTVVHEWGHNMGAHHSASQARQAGPTSFYDWSENQWSAGWQWADAQSSRSDGYCTVMTYEDFDGDGPRDYQQLPYFSNPSVLHAGASVQAAGDAEKGDNARTLRALRSVFEGYRADVARMGDLDADGLPDEWELYYFGGTTSADPTALAANGINTILECYIAGVSPIDSESHFRASLIRDNGFVVHWSAVSGRVYAIHATSRLLDSFEPLETNILWPQSSWTDTVNRSEHFYQVRVKLTE